MSYVLAFAPWIVYAVIPSSQWRWAALAALAITVAETAWGLSRRRPAASMIIEFGSMAFFAAATGLSFADPQTALHPYLPALANGWLAVISWLSLAVRQPFTLGIAKQSTPREAWHQPLFIRTNVIITAVWAACFTVGSAVIATCVAAGAGSGIRALVQVASFVVPMVFTVRYVSVVTARVARIHQARDAAAAQAVQGRAVAPRGE